LLLACGVRSARGESSVHLLHSALSRTGQLRGYVRIAKAALALAEIKGFGSSIPITTRATFRSISPFAQANFGAFLVCARFKRGVNGCTSQRFVSSFLLERWYIRRVHRRLVRL